jgi:hypothetical protein
MIPLAFAADDNRSASPRLAKSAFYGQASHSGLTGFTRQVGLCKGIAGSSDNELNAKYKFG